MIFRSDFTPQAYFNFGVLLGESLKRREEALKLYQESIRIHPNFPDAYHTIGTTYTALGRYAEVSYIHLFFVRSLSFSQEVHQTARC